VSTVIDAPPDDVWHAIEDVATHVDWMTEAVAIRFRTEQRAGVGTTFECDTEVGSLRLTDVMEIISWRPGREMGVRHVGLVTGTGQFRLRRARGDRTQFSWDERLRFPWWLGGPVGALIGGQVLKIIWRRNLRSLKARVESTRQ
jgi:uncharacterized membrane protein